MKQSANEPTPSNAWKWFNPVGRQIGGWGFILNRITALGLTLYLFMHLIVLSQLAVGPSAYEGFLKLIHSPVFVFGELLVVAAAIIHGLNGLRIVLTSFGYGVPQQKGLFYGLMAVALVIILIFSWRMFLG